MKSQDFRYRQFLPTIMLQCMRVPTDVMALLQKLFRSAVRVCPTLNQVV